MKLDRLILVNWGQLNPGDYEMGDMTLLTGETGSGKSTMLDALQTVMTAAYKGVVNYNPGQDEVSQGPRRGKSKRSIESYVVGAEYSKFSRPDGAQGYMAAVFRPDQGEEQAKVFTAVIAASARVEGVGEGRQAKLESFSLHIVDNEALSYTDFMLDGDAGVCVPVEQIGRRLKAAYPRVVEFHDKKRDYLCALYGRFRGKNGVPWDEASKAAKAWVQSIAYRPIGSVHELVRDEILDFDSKQLQQDIERISGLMRQVAGLREHGRRLAASVERLDALSDLLTQTAQAHERHVQQELLVARLQRQLDEKRIAACQKQIENAKALIANLNARIELRGKRAKVLDQERTRLSAQLLGIPVARLKADYELQLYEATAEAKRKLSELSTSLIAAALLDERAKDVTSRPYLNGMTSINAAIQEVADICGTTQLEHLAKHQQTVFLAASSYKVDPEQLLTLSHAFGAQSNTGLDRLHNVMVGTENSLLTALVQEQALLGQQIESADGAVRDLGVRKAKLAKGGVSYPHNIEFAVGRIREQFPQANAQVLCDLVEPVSEEWQQSIEGYLGGARFNVIVPQEWEARILDVVRANNWKVNVVQGSLCLKAAEHISFSADSIVHELRSSNKIAWAYLVEQFGPVVKVGSSEQLRHTRRGLTKDGKGAGGRTMYAVESRDLVFGQKARERQLESVEAQLKASALELERLTGVKKELGRLQSRLAGIKEPHFDASSLGTLAQEIRSASTALASLDLTGAESLEDGLKKVVEELELLAGETRKDEETIYGLNNEITGAHREITAIETNKMSKLDYLERQIARAKAVTEANASLTYTTLSNAVDARLSLTDIDLASEKEELDKLSRRPALLLGQSREALSEYHSQSIADERFEEALPFQQSAAAFDADYPKVVVLLKAAQERLDALRSIGLYNNKVELDEAVKSFNDVFTKNFCAEIKSKVDDGIRTLRQMNNELRSLKFGSDRFTIDWSRWEPEFEDYLDFFNAVYRLMESGEAPDLFGEVELSSKHIEIRDRLVKLLLDDDQERATRELVRIADYRNYRRYDIFNDSDSGGRLRLSEWGTGSGGQLETPAYIVRAAVVTNRLKLFEKTPSLKLLVNDESFAKMDETRARAVLGFLRDNLDLQLISAMPTMKAGSLKDEFTREYSFTRLTPVENGELDFMSECDERILKTDKMRELWTRQRAEAREVAKQLFDVAEPEETDAAEEGERT
jgi:energy-coupling factor transporter ATP-binding protein EcfA2